MRANALFNPDSGAQMMSPHSALVGNPGLAQIIANGGSISELRVNDTLRKDEMRRVDEAVLDVQRETLVGIQDLIGGNLTHDLGDIGTIISEIERLGDMDDATVTFDPVTGQQEDTLAWDLIGIPVPVIGKGFSISARRLRASRNRGEALDVGGARIASRKVADKTEEVLFKGSAATLEGRKIHGYTTHPQRNTIDAATVPGVTNAGVWSDIPNGYKVVNFAIKVAATANHGDGPFNLYVNPENFAELRSRYEDGSSATPASEILSKLPQVRAIKSTKQLATGEAVLVRMVSDVVDMAIAEGTQTVPWQVLPWVFNYLVLAVWVPRVKADKANQSGIVHIQNI